MPIRRAGTISRLIHIAVCIAILPAGCGHKPPPKQSPARTLTEKPSPDRTRTEAKFEGAKVTWDDDQGKRLWEAGFKSATADEAGGSARVELTDVTASLYKDGKVASRMVAPKVVADSAKKEVRAFGGVKVTSLADGSTASADQMIWMPREDKIVGTGGVRMDKGSIHIRAQSITTDTALTKAKLSDAEAIL